MDFMLQMQGVGLSLPGPTGPVRILDNVNLALSPSESVGLVGPSGSGKTSLLMLMAGLERPSSGSIRTGARLGSLELTGLGEDALARFRRGGVGVVFQNFHLVASMTALENTALPLEFAGAPDALDQAAQALGKVGLSGRERHYPAQMSGGEQQRVAIARAFAARPKLLLADEPTGNLDGDTGAKIVELLFSLKDEAGSTLLLVTHDPGLAARCDRRIRLSGGRIVASEPAA